MDNGLKVRQILFESLLDEGDNRKNWEKLCSSGRPLVPFVGAGISAWCYPTWNNLLKEIVEKIYSPQCAEIVQDALACERNPELNVKSDTKNTFHWMEEIAECIFETDTDQYKKYVQIFEPGASDDKNENLALKRLRHYVGDEPNKKVKAVNELYTAFSEEKLKEKGRLPEYQHFFCKLFQDVLVTTNYDKALESCYSSILSYSYRDLDNDKPDTDSWLSRAIKGKLYLSQQKLDGKEHFSPKVTIPEMPMLLKVHGSIEQAEDIALSWSGYEQVYNGKMPKLFREIVKESTMIFLGCGMRDDRILSELGDVVGDSDLFAFLPKLKAGRERENQEQRKLLDRYNIYPIYYSEELLHELMPDSVYTESSYHELFLGLLLENLTRRRQFYPKALEELWDKERFLENKAPVSDMNAAQKKSEKQKQLLMLNKKSKKEWLKDGDPQYVHKEQAREIWDLLNTSGECPLIAIKGAAGTGKSFLCRSIQDLHKSYKDTMQFFYISMDDCINWEEFCVRLCEGLNIIISDIPEEHKWMEIAKRVSERCGVYWRSVLILDHLEEPRESDDSSELWETIKSMLHYWKENHTRVIFVCRAYPKGLSCHTWQIEHLQKDEALCVFLNECNSMRNREISAQEQEVVNTLFDKQAFQASEAKLLGKYANSKSNLSSLLEEWKLYYKQGDKVGQTLARILWNNLLAEHCYEDKSKLQQDNIKQNILWIWGILGKYPRSVPYQFFESGLTEENSYKNKDLSQKTLIYMKNYGLCEETTDEWQDNILENMMKCVKSNFVEGLDDRLKEKYDVFWKKFHREGKGLVWFRGYLMHSYERNLRRYIVEELPDETWNKKMKEEYDGKTRTTAESAEEVLNLLHIIGGQVKSSEVRTSNMELDVILHYETKSIIQFLHAHLADERLIEKAADKKEQTAGELEKTILNIGSDFYNYYQYMPNYAYPFVKRLIERIEKRREDRAENEEWDIPIAKLSKVMGDIQRLMGKKEAALESYKKALKLCNELVLSKMGGDEHTYHKILHIKAGVLLAINYYENRPEQSDEAKAIYENMSKDKPGQAYYNQRMAELEMEKYSKDKPPKGAELKSFEQMKAFSIKALTLFKEVERENKKEDNEENGNALHEEDYDNTKIAYMLKSTGDLIVEFREDIEKKGENLIYSIDKAFLELKSNAEPDKTAQNLQADWFSAAAEFYLQSFIDYCHHINWRGLANVLQAMGTCMRGRDMGKEKTEKKEVENIYNMAEECYRWINDVRGLADTLDYFGYYYEEIKGINVTPENAVYKYMALSKWKESRKLWEQQGNSDKAGIIGGRIEQLEKKLVNYKIWCNNNKAYEKRKTESIENKSAAKKNAVRSKSGNRNSGNRNSGNKKSANKKSINKSKAI